MIYGKEGMVVVASAWITWSLFGALPFTLSGSIPNFVDAFFETVSGFTTTGSSILRDVEALPQCMLFWRSFTHWIGGMGVLVFVLMLTNLDKKNSMYLMRAEVPGPEKDKLVPKTKTTARILYGIYFGLTLILVILLMFGGMNLFDSLIHAFGSAGTGGFSNYADSVGHFDSAYIDYVISIFMILFGINFNLYYFMLLGDFKAFWKNEELRVYLGIIATATILITLNTNQMYGSIMKAFRYALFQDGEIIEYATVEEIFYEPCHPYTWSLLSSLPQLADDKGELFSIPGTPPSLYTPVVGDAFALRSDYAMQIDFEEKAPQFQVSDTHWAKTWLLHEDAPKVEKPEVIQNLHEKIRTNMGFAHLGDEEEGNA